jgi:hypothetical protein
MSNGVIAVSIAGGNHKGDRIKDDFYASPPECVTSFLAMEAEHLHGKKIWEPACGDGAISKILEDAGFDVLSTDLIYRGYGEGDKDFLWTMETDCDAIITNPPFNLSEKFIWHALETLDVKYLALLLKSQYWHSKKRAILFEKHPPAIVYPLTWRPDFLNKGAPTMDCQWTVWRQSETATLYKPMSKFPVHKFPIQKVS